MNQSVEQIVQAKYGQVAQSTLSSADAGVREIARAFGYSAEELSSIPAGANMGLSCGNPTATASLRPGETVVDLGSGGGMDVFLAAAKVGPTGRAIGIDMTPEMIQRAGRNAAAAHVSNVEFLQANIDRLPLADGSIDCVISNCVINLAADKPAVFREMFRVLKPGGRVAVSDVALKQKLPEDLARDVMAYVGCIAGAISVDDFERGLQDAGFGAVHIVDSGADLNAYTKLDGQSGCCSPAMTAEPATAASNSADQKAMQKAGGLSIAADSRCGPSCCSPSSENQSLHAGLANILERYNVNEYAASVKIYAIKPMHT